MIVKTYVKKTWFLMKIRLNYFFVQCSFSALNTPLLSLWSNLANYGINLQLPLILSLELLDYPWTTSWSCSEVSLEATELSNDDQDYHWPGENGALIFIGRTQTLHYQDSYWPSANQNWLQTGNDRVCLTYLSKLRNTQIKKLIIEINICYLKNII